MKKLLVILILLTCSNFGYTDDVSVTMAMLAERAKLKKANWQSPKFPETPKTPEVPIRPEPIIPDIPESIVYPSIWYWDQYANKLWRYNESGNIETKEVEQSRAIPEIRGLRPIQNFSELFRQDCVDGSCNNRNLK